MIPAPFHLYRLELSLASAMTSSSLQARSGIHVHIRMIMINILYTFLVIYFPDVMPTLAALTGGTPYLPQKIKCELHQKTGQYLEMQKAGKVIGFVKLRVCHGLIKHTLKTFYKNIIAFKDVFKLCRFLAHPCTTFAINFKC